MNYIDRTLDFHNEVKSFTPGIHLNKNETSKTLQSPTTESLIPSDLNNLASARQRIRTLESSSISHNTSVDNQLNLIANNSDSLLNDVEERLQEMEKLVKRRGIFEDHNSKIEDIATDINQTFESLRNNISKLEDLLNSSHSKNTQSNAHFQTIITNLKLRSKALTKTSGAILEIRSKNIKKQENRHAFYSGNSSISTKYNPYQFLNSQENTNYDEQSGFQLTQQINRPVFDYSYSRKEAMDNVLKVISELGQIFNRITDLVAEQDEVIMRIDHNIDISADNVNEGKSNLLTYYNRISSNRSLIIKVFAIIFVFIIFFVIFLT